MGANLPCFGHAAQFNHTEIRLQTDGRLDFIKRVMEGTIIALAQQNALEEQNTFAFPHFLLNRLRKSRKLNRQMRDYRICKRKNSWVLVKIPPRVYQTPDALAKFVSLCFVLSGFLRDL